MDLDALKNKWQNQQVSSSMDDDLIEKVLKKKGGTALDKLTKIELLLLILNIGCVLCIPLAYYIRYSLFFIIGFGLLWIISVGWSYYKVRLLKKINITTMNLVDVYLQVTRYRKLIVYEIILGILLLFLFDLAFVFEDAKAHDIYLFADIDYILRFVFVYIITMLILAVVYYKYYWKNIKKLLKAIDETSSLMKEEIDTTV